MKKGRLGKFLLAVATVAFASALAVPAMAFAANGTIAGAGTESEPYLIEDMADLKVFRDAVNNGDSYDDKYVKLEANIDLQNAEWVPIGTSANPFNGMFDGNGKTVSNLRIPGDKTYVSGGSNDNYKGLFGYMKGGSNAGIKNLTIDNADVAGCLYVGAILGRSYTSGIIENCHVTGSVKIDGYSYIGGIVGRHDYSEGYNASGEKMAISSCSVKDTSSEKGLINGDYAVTYAGGIVGFVGEGKYVIDACAVESVEVSGTYGLGGISGIAHYGNTISDVVVKDVAVTSTDNDPNSIRTDNVGLIAGACQGKDSEPSIITGASASGSTGYIAYADGSSAEIDNLYGGSMDGSAAVTNWVAKVGDALYESLQEAVNAGGDVALLRNVTSDNALVIPDGRAVSLDLNEKTLNGSILAPDATLSVANGAIVNNNSSVSAIEINAGKLTLADVDIDSARHAVRIDGAVEATIDGGTYRGAIGTGAGTYHAVNVSGAANVTIKSGTFVGPKGTSADSGSAVNVQAGAKASIEGGSFSGGKNSTLASNGTLAVSGGTFDQDPASYVADGYVSMHDSGAGVYVVGKAVAEVDGVQYGTLEGALKALTRDSTLTLLQDVTFDEVWDCRNNGAQITVPATIDGGNHTLELIGATDDRNWETVFRFEDNATVKNLTIDASKVTNIQRGISSKLGITVENCTLIGNGTTAWMAIIYGEGAGAAIADVSATVKDSKFINWKLGVSDNQNGQDAESVSITGSTFENAGVLVSASETAVFTGNTMEGAGVNISSYSDSNELAVTATGNALDPSEDNKIIAGDITAQDGFATPVARVGGKLYDSLQAAIRAAAGVEDKTATLLADVTVSGSVDTSGVTVEQGGYKIILSAGASLNSDAELNVSAESGCYVAVEGDAESGYTYTSKPIPYIPPAEPECGPGDACVDFNDVDPDAWYHEVIDWAVANDILRGYDDGSGNVGPEDVTLRAHVMVMLHRMAGEPEPSDGAAFNDVAAGAWYSDAVAWAAEAGLTTGYTDGSGKFGTGDAMTREQMATVLYRFAILMGLDVSVGEDTNILSYYDFDEVSEYAIPAMQWAVGAGIIGGYTDADGEPTGFIGPKDDAERAHFAAMLMRMDEAYGIL